MAAAFKKKQMKRKKANAMGNKLFRPSRPPPPPVATYTSYQNRVPTPVHVGVIPDENDQEENNFTQPQKEEEYVSTPATTAPLPEEVFSEEENIRLGRVISIYTEFLAEYRQRVLVNDAIITFDLSDKENIVVFDLLNNEAYLCLQQKKDEGDMSLPVMKYIKDLLIRAPPTCPQVYNTITTQLGQPLTLRNNITRTFCNIVAHFARAGPMDWLEDELIFDTLNALYNIDDNIVTQHYRAEVWIKHYNHINQIIEENVVFDISVRDYFCIMATEFIVKWNISLITNVDLTNFYDNTKATVRNIWNKKRAQPTPSSSSSVKTIAVNPSFSRPPPPPPPPPRRGGRKSKRRRGNKKGSCAPLSNPRPTRSRKKGDRYGLPGRAKREPQGDRYPQRGGKKKRKKRKGGERKKENAGSNVLTKL
jgi:hypothetical protein